MESLECIVRNGLAKDSLLNNLLQEFDRETPCTWTSAATQVLLEFTEKAVKNKDTGKCNRVAEVLHFIAPRVAEEAHESLIKVYVELEHRIEQLQWNLDNTVWSSDHVASTSMFLEITKNLFQLIIELWPSCGTTLLKSIGGHLLKAVVDPQLLYIYRILRIKAFIQIIHKCDQTQLDFFKKENFNLLFSLPSALNTAGDYELQNHIVEALHRLFRFDERSSYVARWFANLHYTQHFLFTRIKDFNVDTRRFLNVYNNSLADKRSVHTFAASKVTLAGLELKKPRIASYEMLWVDFNENSSCVSLVIEDSSVKNIAALYSCKTLSIYRDEVQSAVLKMSMHGARLTLGLIGTVRELFSPQPSSQLSALQETVNPYLEFIFDQPSRNFDQIVRKLHDNLLQVQWDLPAGTYEDYWFNSRCGRASLSTGSVKVVQTPVKGDTGNAALSHPPECSPPHILHGDGHRNTVKASVTSRLLCCADHAQDLSESDCDTEEIISPTPDSKFSRNRIGHTSMRIRSKHAPIHLNKELTSSVRRTPHQIKRQNHSRIIRSVGSTNSSVQTIYPESPLLIKGHSPAKELSSVKTQNLLPAADCKTTSGECLTVIGSSCQPSANFSVTVIHSSVESIESIIPPTAESVHITKHESSSKLSLNRSKHVKVSEEHDSDAISAISIPLLGDLSKEKVVSVVDPSKENVVIGISMKEQALLTKDLSKSGTVPIANSSKSNSTHMTGTQEIGAIPFSGFSKENNIRFEDTLKENGVPSIGQHLKVNDNILTNLSSEKDRTFISDPKREKKVPSTFYRNEKAVVRVHEESLSEELLPMVNSPKCSQEVLSIQDTPLEIISDAVPSRKSFTAVNCVAQKHELSLEPTVNEGLEKITSSECAVLPNTSHARFTEDSSIQLAGLAALPDVYRNENLQFSPERERLLKSSGMFAAIEETGDEPPCKKRKYGCEPVCPRTPIAKQICSIDRSEPEVTTLAMKSTTVHKQISEHFASSISSNSCILSVSTECVDAVLYCDEPLSADIGMNAVNDEDVLSRKPSASFVVKCNLLTELDPLPCRVDTKKDVCANSEYNSNSYNVVDANMKQVNIDEKQVMNNLFASNTKLLDANENHELDMSELVRETRIQNNELSHGSNLLVEKYDETNFKSLFPVTIFKHSATEKLCTTDIAADPAVYNISLNTNDAITITDLDCDFDVVNCNYILGGTNTCSHGDLKASLSVSENVALSQRILSDAQVILSESCQASGSMKLVSEVQVQENVSEMQVQENVSEVQVQENVSEVQVQENVSEVQVQENVSEVPVQENVSEVPAQESVSELREHENIFQVQVLGNVSEMQVHEYISEVLVQGKVSGDHKINYNELAHGCRDEVTKLPDTMYLYPDTSNGQKGLIERKVTLNFTDLWILYEANVPVNGSEIKEFNLNCERFIRNIVLYRPPCTSHIFARTVRLSSSEIDHSNSSIISVKENTLNNDTKTENDLNSLSKRNHGDTVTSLSEVASVSCKNISNIRSDQCANNLSKRKKKLRKLPEHYNRMSTTISVLSPIKYIKDIKRAGVCKKKLFNASGEILDTSPPPPSVDQSLNIVQQSDCNVSNFTLGDVVPLEFSVASDSQQNKDISCSNVQCQVPPSSSFAVRLNRNQTARRMQCNSGITNGKVGNRKELKCDRSSSKQVDVVTEHQISKENLIHFESQKLKLVDERKNGLGNRKRRNNTSNNYRHGSNVKRRKYNLFSLSENSSDSERLKSKTVYSDYTSSDCSWLGPNKESLCSYAQYRQHYAKNSYEQSSKKKKIGNAMYHDRIVSPFIEESSKQCKKGSKAPSRTRFGMYSLRKLPQKCYKDSSSDDAKEDATDREKANGKQLSRIRCESWSSKVIEQEKHVEEILRECSNTFMESSLSAEKVFDSKSDGDVHDEGNRNAAYNVNAKFVEEVINTRIAVCDDRMNEGSVLPDNNTMTENAEQCVANNKKAPTTCKPIYFSTPYSSGVTLERTADISKISPTVETVQMHLEGPLQSTMFHDTKVKSTGVLQGIISNSDVDFVSDNEMISLQRSSDKSDDEAVQSSNKLPKVRVLLAKHHLDQLDEAFDFVTNQAVTEDSSLAKEMVCAVEPRNSSTVPKNRLSESQDVAKSSVGHKFSLPPSDYLSVELPIKITSGSCDHDKDCCSLSCAQRQPAAAQLLERTALNTNASNMTPPRMKACTLFSPISCCPPAAIAERIGSEASRENNASVDAMLRIPRSRIILLQEMLTALQDDYNSRMRIIYDELNSLLGCRQ